ncbi:MAG: hypothetical protein HZA17_05160 [Nitrospirae bacterium]|nr:hypothetical protein [Nitrospirota bacterium]
MKYLAWTAAVLLTFMLQGRISILGISPNLTAVLAFYAGIRYGEVRGLLIGSVIGACEDSISLSLIGPNLLGKGMVGFFSSFFVSGGVFRWTPLLGMIAIAFLTTIDNSIVFLSKSIFDKMPSAPGSGLFIALMQSLLSAPAGIFIRPRHVD